MSGEHIVDVTEATFNAEVVDYSKKVPVIVDFWASWCGPCKTLGPILEELADEYKGAFRLAKVDVDRNQQLATAARVQSIPTVVAVHQGGVIEQFMGALPRSEVKRFIDLVLSRAGVSPRANADEIPVDPAKAEAYWKAKLDKDEKDGEALFALGQLALSTGDTERAKSTFEKIDASMDEYTSAQASLQVLELSSIVAQAGGEQVVKKQLADDPDSPQAKYLMACQDACQGRFAQALEALVDLVGARPGNVVDDAKKAAAVVLSAAGRGDEKVEALRRRLSLLLF